MHEPECRQCVESFCGAFTPKNQSTSGKIRPPQVFISVAVIFLLKEEKENENHIQKNRISASDSYNVVGSLDGNKTILTFSNLATFLINKA